MNSAVVSIAGSEPLRTCHGGSALPSLQSLSPLPNTTHLCVCVCVCRVEDHYMASPSLPFTVYLVELHVMPYTIPATVSNQNTALANSGF